MNNISPFKFKNKPVRVIRVDGQPMMAVVDAISVDSLDQVIFGLPQGTAPAAMKQLGVDVKETV